MNVLYCGDDNMEDNLILSVLSLLRNVEEKLNIYVMTMRIKTQEKTYHPVSKATITMLDQWVKKENAASFVTLLDMTKQFEEELPAANLETEHTPYSMLWMYADKVSELPERILHLDMDVICRQDCGAYYHQDIRGYELAGSLDHRGKWFYHNSLTHLDYLNSGVLLLNLKEIRETGLLEKCRKLCSEKAMKRPDQMAFNKLAEAKKILSDRYNEQRRFRENTVFQQFTEEVTLFSFTRALVKKIEQLSWFPMEESTHEDEIILKEYAALIAEMKVC